MPDEGQTNNDSSDANKKEDSTSPATVRAKPWRWYLIFGVLFLVIGITSLYLFVRDVSPRTQFLATSILTFLTLMTILGQLYIYQKQREAMQEQLKVMQDQTTALQGSLTETRKAVRQNERAVEASEQSARAAEESTTLAREVFYVGEAAYFGVKDVVVGDIVTGRQPIVRITLVNCGKTPAWHVLIDVGMVLAALPGEGDIWDFTAAPNISNSFFSAGEERSILYNKTKLVITEERHDAIKNETNGARLYIFGTVHYSDFRRQPQSYSFCVVYIPETGKCYDYQVP